MAWSSLLDNCTLGQASLGLLFNASSSPAGCFLSKVELSVTHDPGARPLGERNASWALGYDREMFQNGACCVKTLVPSHRVLIDCSRAGPPREGRTNTATLDVPCLFLLCLSPDYHDP